MAYRLDGQISAQTAITNAKIRRRGTINSQFLTKPYLWDGIEKIRHYSLGIEIGSAVYASSD
jgi:hypothetical protein